MPADALSEESKQRWLTFRTFVTDHPEVLATDDVPVFEFSVIDTNQVRASDAELAIMISRAWTRFRLKTEGWFVLTLRKDGKTRDRVSGVDKHQRGHEHGASRPESIHNSVFY